MTREPSVGHPWSRPSIYSTDSNNIAVQHADDAAAIRCLLGGMEDAIPFVLRGNVEFILKNNSTKRFSRRCCVPISLTLWVVVVKKGLCSGGGLVWSAAPSNNPSSSSSSIGNKTSTKHLSLFVEMLAQNKEKEGRAQLLVSRVAIRQMVWNALQRLNLNGTG